MLTSPRPAAPTPLPSECGRWLSPQKPCSGLPRPHACADPSSHFARSSQGSGAPHLSTMAARGTSCDCWAGWSSAHVPRPLSPCLHGLQDQPLWPPRILCVQLRVPPTPQHMPVASALAVPTCPHLFQTLAQTTRSRQGSASRSVAITSLTPCSASPFLPSQFIHHVDVPFTHLPLSLSPASPAVPRPKLHEA